MFTIGQFSRICRVPPKTLRYYDEIGLLKPAQINISNQYRYYSVKQILLVREIALYKEMGLSLEAIKSLISVYETEKGEQFLKLLASQKERIEGEITSLQQRLSLLEDFIRNYQKVDLRSIASGTQIVVKDVPAIKVISVRDKGPYIKMGKLFSELGSCVSQNNLKISGLIFGIYHDEEYSPDDADMEACLPVEDAVSGGRIHFQELPPCKVASGIHVGPYEQLNGTFARIIAWINQKEYSFAGPSREVFLVSPSQVKSPEEYVTEVQIPVKL